MKSIRFMLLSFVVLAFVFAGFYGCAKKQVKTNEGQIKQVMPSTANNGSSTSENGKSKREVTEAPPGPKEQPQPVEAGKEEKALNDIHFDLDRYDIKADDASILQKDYNWIKANNPKGLIVVEGNCDERGTVEYNLALGERRAQAAEKYLVSLGVAKSRMKTISYGKSKPVDPGHDEAAWAKNRRDHFVVQ